MTRKKRKKCAICALSLNGSGGNNAYPVLKKESQRVCDQCNIDVIAPARLSLYTRKNYGAYT